MAQNLSEITDRLLRLESAYRRMKIVGFSASVLLGIIVLSTQAPPARTVSAQEFILTDAQGNSRGTWSVTPDGGSFLRMYDQSNHERLSLYSSDDGATVNLIGVESSEQRVPLSAGTHDSTLRLSDSRGFSTWLGNAYLQSEKKGTQKNTSAASLVLFGKEGEVLWSAP
jgi:hypothetical protein